MLGKNNKTFNVELNNIELFLKFISNKFSVDTLPRIIDKNFYFNIP